MFWGHAQTRIITDDLKIDAKGKLLFFMVKNWSTNLFEFYKWMIKSNDRFSV